MLIIRLVLIFTISLVLVQAEPNNYIRGEKVNPASRIINNGKSQHVSETVDKENDIIEFHSLTRFSGSKPVQEGLQYRKAE